ncbi:aminotransferase class I/II-fold pyridoxal phosphate-dependent enzyme [Candidatus Woesearchaeota archaeon]|nr:aminotransferase class I/II-fold pyridoxal phosphate-dependent enzyme [Candidatus Woesearchaeota archaeon]
MKLEPEAEELNGIIKNLSPTAYSLLSERGLSIYFPKKGILSQTAESKGKRINATIGTAIDNDGSPMRIKPIEVLVSVRPEDAFSYAPSAGKKELRKKWKEKIYDKNPSLKGKQISNPIVTAGITHAMCVAGFLFADEGKKIIAPDMLWENYNLIFSNTYKSEIESYNLFDRKGFDVASLRSKLEKQEKSILLFNFPNNPTGYTVTVEEADNIAEAVKEHAENGNKILAIIDDAYFGLVYEKGIENESLFSRLACVHENVLAVKIDGPTKEDYVWGFRLGCITIGIKNGTSALYNAIESKIEGAVRATVSNASNLSQSLVLKAYSSPEYKKEKEEKYSMLKSRYDAVKETLERKREYSKFFEPLPFNSGYFMCVKLKGSLDAEKIRKTLLERYDTGVISLGNLLRIAFSSVDKKDIPELFENIYRACKENEKQP